MRYQAIKRIFPKESFQKSSSQIVIWSLEMEDDYIELTLIIKKLGT